MATHTRQVVVCGSPLDIEPWRGGISSRPPIGKGHGLWPTELKGSVGSVSVGFDQTCPHRASSRFVSDGRTGRAGNGSAPALIGQAYWVFRGNETNRLFSPGRFVSFPLHEDTPGHHGAFCRPRLRRGHICGHWLINTTKTGSCNVHTLSANNVTLSAPGPKSTASRCTATVCVADSRRGDGEKEEQWPKST